MSTIHPILILYLIPADFIYVHKAPLGMRILSNQWRILYILVDKARGTAYIPGMDYIDQAPKDCPTGLIRGLILAKTAQNKVFCRYKLRTAPIFSLLDNMRALNRYCQSDRTI
jgi:hypothetical protein